VICKKKTAWPTLIDHCPALVAALRGTSAVNASTRAETLGLNHLFQHAKTAAVSEYAQIAETFAPEAMEKIAAWILAVQ